MHHSWFGHFRQRSLVHGIHVHSTVQRELFISQYSNRFYSITFLALDFIYKEKWKWLVTFFFEYIMGVTAWKSNNVVSMDFWAFAFLVHIYLYNDACLSVLLPHPFFCWCSCNFWRFVYGSLFPVIQMLRRWLTLLRRSAISVKRIWDCSGVFSWKWNEGKTCAVTFLRASPVLKWMMKGSSSIQTGFIVHMKIFFSGSDRQAIPCWQSYLIICYGVFKFNALG